MSASYLTSTLVMGALAVLVLVAVVRSRRWYHYSPDPDEREHGAPALEGRTQPSLLERPGTWIAGFVALMLLAVGGVFAFVTNPDAPAELFSVPILAGGGLLVGGFLLYGTYVSAKGRGHPSSIAAAETATVVGALFLIAVSAQLIG
jgi:hypothetical protein